MKKKIMISVSVLAATAAIFFSIYFIGTGVLKNGWTTTENGQMYYSSGNYVTGLHKIENEYYLFDDNGIMLFGENEYNCDLYFSQPDTGVVRTGWVDYKYESYYYNNFGYCVTGEQVIDGKDYYFREDGTLQIGWRDKDNKRYYYDRENGILTGLQEINGNKYYFDKNGVLQTGFITVDGTQYYFCEDGKMATTLTKIGNDYYGSVIFSGICSFGIW